MAEKINVKFAVLFFVLCAGNISVVWSDVGEPQEEKVTKEQNDSSVMKAFTSNEVKDSEIVAIEDDTKRLVMFVLGVPLLLFIIATVIFGVAMGVYGKQVFVAHMVCAGFSLTLALAHAVVGIVWFYPF